MLTRRDFIRGGAATGAALAFPSIIPARVLGAAAPSKKITVGVIGCGRIARGFNIPGCLSDGGRDLCDFIAVCDVDPDRRNHYRRLLATEKYQGRDLVGASRCYADYRQMLANPAIDGIMITVPDHWHAQMAIEACRARKDVFFQKPMAMTIGEGRAIVDAVKKYGVILRTGTQERATEQFIHAVECVRDGRLGKVVRVEVGVPEDPNEPADLPLEEPVPQGFDWNMWQGCVPEAPYAQLRTHRRGKDGRVDYSLRGWMMIQDYDLGMVANWGAHHIDTALRGISEERGGPLSVVGTCDYPKRRLWNTHGECDVTWTYPSGTVMKLGSTRKYPCGIRWIGENGDWIFCGFGSGDQQVRDDPKNASPGELEGRKIATNRKTLIEGPVAKPLPRLKEHNRQWIEEMRTRGPLAMPLEEAQRTSTACILGYLAMKLGRKLNWDAKAERFVGDDEANRMLFREERAGFGVKQYLKDLEATGARTGKRLAQERGSALPSACQRNGCVRLISNRRKT